MTTVDRVRVGDVLRLERRAVPVDVSTEYEEIGIRSFGRGIFHKEPVKGAALGDKRVFWIEPGDLVISNVFAWEGAIAVATETEAGRIGSHRFMTYVPREERIDVSWARWFFLSEYGLGLIEKASPGSAGRNKTLAVRRFEDLVIPLPPIDDQRRAAGRVDFMSERSAAAIAAINRTPPQVVIETLPVLIDHKVAQHAPGVANVGDLADLVSDIVHPGEDPAPASSFVGLQHVESHTGRNLGSDPLETVKGRKFRFAPGDVIYGYLRPYLNKVWVADRHGLCSVDQYVLRPKPSVDPELLSHVLRGRYVLDEAIGLTHNLQLPRLRSGLLLALQVRWPSSADARSLVEDLDEVSDAILTLARARERQLQTLASLLPSVLNREFAGHS